VKKKQKAGEVLTAYATDKAGNKSAGQTFKVVDKTPPGTPTVNKVTTRSTSVSGKAEQGATVYLYSGHHYLGKATASSKGYYKIGMHKQKKGTKLSVYAKDKAGNKSKTRTIKVV
ncbi:MAG TPA: Ig-like domain-containing protein, partial [Sporolactobacillaceae bacterium]|nr:Ig-like domain-containing protein [Sporolactobacillaceae bacterium]